MPIASVFPRVFDEIDCRKLIALVDEVCQRYPAPLRSIAERQAVARLVLLLAQRDGLGNGNLVATTLSEIARAGISRYIR